MNIQNKFVCSGMSTTPEKLNIDDIIASLQTLDNNERARLQSALFDLQNDLDLKAVIRENLDDIRSGRVSSHQAVMNEIKAAL